MEFPKPEIEITLEKGKTVKYKILSFDEFKRERGLFTLSNSLIDYHIGKERLDYTTIGRFRYIIWNEKAQEFNLSYQKAPKTI